MKRTKIVTTIAISSLFVLGLLSVAPTAAANDSVLELYFSDDGFTPQAPTGEETSLAAITGLVSFPAGLGFPIEIASFEVPADFLMTSDPVLTAWLTADEAFVATTLEARLFRGDAMVAAGTTGTWASTGAENVITSDGFTRVDLAIPLSSPAWTAGDRLNLRFWISGVSADGLTGANQLYLAYGSVNQPSRLAFAVDGPGLPVAPIVDQVLYLGPESSITTEAPTAEDPLARATESDYEGVGPATIASATTWTWGTWTVPQDMTIGGASAVKVWLSVDGVAAAQRGIRTYVDFAGTELTQSANVRGYAYQDVDGGPSTFAVALALPTEGIELAAGDEVAIKFVTWSTSGSGGGDVVFLYGSADRPSGLHLSIEGAGLASAADDVIEDIESGVNNTLDPGDNATNDLDNGTSNVGGSLQGNGSANGNGSVGEIQRIDIARRNVGAAELPAAPVGLVIISLLGLIGLQRRRHA